MENLKVLTIGELIAGGRPLSGTSYLRSFLKVQYVSTKPSQSKSVPIPSVPSQSNPNSDPHKVLTPLDYPTIIVGTITLPDVISSSEPTPRCPYDSCLQFSDGSVTICCDILDLDISMIGKKIRVVAWNFIPIKRRGGFLEIILWNCLESDDGPRGPSRCSSEDWFSLDSSSGHVREDSSQSKCRYFLHGAVESVSAISVVPCTSGSSKSERTTCSNSSSSSNLLRGFLVQFLTCECKFCSSNVEVMNDSIQKQNPHCLAKPMFVYFCGTASSWHPVMTKLVGRIVNMSGLKKRLVYLGKEESCLMHVTTEKSKLRLSRLCHKWFPNGEGLTKGKGELGTYTGIIRGVHMQGMVVELDSEVWLLLTNQPCTSPHSLRVGALISVRNVHFVNPKFSWTKMLILGACLKTSITVESFSPLVTECHILSQSQSMLGNFIQSLAFAARLWVLLLVSCFRKKFFGILSEKEILGSKNKEGLVQSFATSKLPLSMQQYQQGVFMVLCKHNIYCFGYEQFNYCLKLMVPISNFLSSIEASWMKTQELEHQSKTFRDNSERKSHDHLTKVLSSADIGIVLVGLLKMSPTGRLQLVDATGGIDVLVPDLPTSWNINNIYEVIDYSLVVGSNSRLVDCMESIKNGPLSCRSIFNFIPLARHVNLKVCVYFCLRHAACKNSPLYPQIEPREDFDRLEIGTYHLLRITHKFPGLQKFQGETFISDGSSMFVEAMVLTWNLNVAENDDLLHPTKDSGDQVKKLSEYHKNGCHQEYASFKRQRINDASNTALSDERNIPPSALRKLTACSSSYEDSSEKQRCCASSYDIFCSATIRGANNHDLVRSVVLYRTGADRHGCGFCRAITNKVLLEFKSESFYKYQSLQIGHHYIAKHDKAGSFCNLKDSVSGVKIIVTPKTHLWSISFASNEVLWRCESKNHASDDLSVSDDKDEVILHVSNLLARYSDVSLLLPSNIMGMMEINMSELEMSLVEPAPIPDNICDVSACPILASSLISNSICLLPVGNLISLRGHVIVAHSFDQSHVDTNSSFTCREAGSFCFHVFVDHKVVIIYGSFSKCALPVGFGPGVDATFHRVLELRVENRWMLTPVSFISINSIRVVKCSSNYKFLSPASYIHNISSLEVVSSGLIVDLVQRLDSKPMQLYCRVVAISILVLEKNNKKDVFFQPMSSQHLAINIPLAGFIVDDGSSQCCCWASDERAATLLRVHKELPLMGYVRKDWTKKETGTVNNKCRTICSHLERILKIHGRITVKNYGSCFDSSCQDLAISVVSNSALSISDENIIKFIVFNACFGAYMKIVASLMDSNGIRQLEENKLLETVTNMHSMQNVWVTEVHYRRPLAEARNAIQELLDGG